MHSETDSLFCSVYHFLGRKNLGAVIQLLLYVRSYVRTYVRTYVRIYVHLCQKYCFRHLATVAAIPLSESMREIRNCFLFLFHTNAHRLSELGMAQHARKSKTSSRVVKSKAATHA